MLHPGPWALTWSLGSHLAPHPGTKVNARHSRALSCPIFACFGGYLHRPHHVGAAKDAPSPMSPSRTGWKLGSRIDLLEPWAAGGIHKGDACDEPAPGPSDTCATPACIGVVMLLHTITCVSHVCTHCHTPTETTGSAIGAHTGRNA